jgi:alkyldihydroxyacetonephosphate synthase
MKQNPKDLNEYLHTISNEGITPVDPDWISNLSNLLGADRVLIDDESINEHSYDVWAVSSKWKNQNKRMFAPQVVVKPQSTEEVSTILKWATEKKVPVTPWGGGSSVTGQPLPTRGGISLDMSAMDQIISVNDENLIVNVQAGKFGDKLEEELNQKGYTLNHSPQSLDRSTIGGWVATRAMGQFSSRYGGIEDLLITFTVVLPTGEIIKMMNVPRGAVGPDLRHVFVGAEGILGVVTEVSIKIFPVAEFQLFETVAFDTVEAGLTVMRTIMRLGIQPFLVRFYDQDESHHAMKDDNFKTCVMFLGFQGVEGIARTEYQAVMELCKTEGGKILGPAGTEAWMARRFDFSTVENTLEEPGGIAETIEIAHFWDGILETYYECKKAAAPYAKEVISHFSHIYPQGTSLYIILLGKDKDDATAEANLIEFWDVIMRICLKNGAAISHHHGSGLARGPYVADALGSSMQVLRRMKAEFDPAGIMNPGKLVF